MEQNQKLILDDLKSVEGPFSKPRHAMRICRRIASLIPSQVTSWVALLVVWLATDEDGPPSKLDCLQLRRAEAAKVEAEALAKAKKAEVELGRVAPRVGVISGPNTAGII